MAVAAGAGPERAPGSLADGDAPVVVKLGGELLDAPVLAIVAADLARAVRESGRPIAVVHGGGPQATALSQRLGLRPVIVGGRRVTDAATLDVVKMIVAGRLNVDLTAALAAAGVAAVGLHGAGGLIRARRRPPRVVSGGGDTPVDFGLVGDVVGFDLPLLTALWSAGRVPVIACVAGADSQSGDSQSGDSEAGAALNINADVVASQLASALAADRPLGRPVTLVAATAVGGVRRDAGDPASRIVRMTAAEARAAIADGTIRGGMIPKVEEALGPLGAGSGAVHIVGPGEIAACLAAPGSVGTVLVP